jgi:hypothetical protein
MIKEILDNGNGVRITVTGSSMYPFLREKIDSVELFPGSFNCIHIGDIVMIQRDSGEYVMHRVIKKKKDCFYIVGDAQLWVEGPIRQEQLTAVVNAIWRKNKKIKCSNTLWRVLSFMWLCMFPFRKVLFKVYRLLRLLC